ncbi:MAG: hypothetical protein ISR65_00465 [Bacteriovoracaceae bacterium]|nr:hypothetical protein [Bacteriovoracaceae bacterium]
MVKLVSLFSIIILSSCSSLGLFKATTSSLDLISSYALYDNKDHAYHLNVLGKHYINSPNVLQINLSRSDQEYLTSLYNKITHSNELLLNRQLTPKFYIIVDESPFYFSLPNVHFFFSYGLINKYITHEGPLASLLAYEIIKSHRQIYTKSTTVPLGYIGTEQMIHLTRIPTNKKMQLNKWTYWALKRAELHPQTYLMWLQIQNKNALDFALQFGDIRRISKEEFLFKNFIVKQKQPDNDENLATNSSKQFYKFIHSIKNRKIFKRY